MPSGNRQLGLIKVALLAMIVCSTAVAQQTGAPPFFTGKNKLYDTVALASVKQKMKTLSDSGSAPLRLLHLGDSHVKSGFFAEAFADSLARYFFQTFGRANVVELTVMAKNGATSKHFLEDVYDANEVKSFGPDAVIVSLGTNEANNLYTGAELQTYFTQLLAQIKADAPRAAIIFTTPGDALRKTTSQVKKRKRYYTVTRFSANSVLPTVVEFIKSFAQAAGASYWDWYAVMGGRGAIVRWVGHGYANDDRIHLVEKGYRLQGHLMATALINYFKN